MTTPPTTQELVVATLAYAARKWYVMPLHDVTQGQCSCGNPQCPTPGKHPRILDWADAASINLTQIRRWWTQWPYANVGLLTGERSGLAVLDVDPRNGGDLALEDLEESYGPLPDTPMVISGGKGPHHYFGLDGPLGKFDPGPGLNLQADGALVVAPPSLHSSGNRYEWEVSSHPDDVPLAPLPDWLRAMGEAKASAKVDGVNLPDVLPVVELHSLKLSTRMKYVLLTGNDPDDPRRYPSRSEALFAAISAMVHAGYDDATIAGVIMDKRYAISEKGWDQKNPKSPYYVEQTKAWVAGEIARARAKHAQLHVSSQARPQAASAPGQGGTVTTTVWAHAVTAQEFLQQVDTDPPAAVKDLVVPGCITVVSAPRASGKTIVALFLSVALATRGIFRGERLDHKHVLLVDRDNPPALIRKRLRWLGAQTVTDLKVLMRDKAPPLTDKAAWSTFPVQDYDVVIVDSLGASTEGISEKEGRQTQEFLATLKDLARRGPALLCLDNTTKAATNYRGRGEKADAVDILYECRNVTGWTPSQAGPWWEDLPDFGEHTWQQRATRRQGQAVLRIAFIPSKFRLGIEPEPFVLEVDTRNDPWTLADVTEDIAIAGTQAADETRRQERAKIAHAEAQLAKAITARPADAPMLKEEAVTLLCGYGLTRKAARTLLESGGNNDIYPQGRWIIRSIPGHTSGKALGVYLAGEENDGERSNVIQFPRQYTPTDQSPSAVGSTPHGERLAPVPLSDNAGVNGANLSPPPGDSTAEGDTSPDEQPCGNFGVGGPSAVHTPSAAPFSHTARTPPADGLPLTSLTPVQSCPQCGGTDWLELVTYRKCAVCGWKSGPTPADILQHPPAPERPGEHEQEGTI